MRQRPRAVRTSSHVPAGNQGHSTASGGDAGRNRYVDLVRLAAIVVVVVGHWLVTTIVLVDGRLVGQSALAVVGYARWLTLLLQVMPMFFLAGGYAAAAAWPSWRTRGGRWAGWMHNRIVRLLRPTSWFVAIMAGLVVLARIVGVDPALLAQAGWAVALLLWFLPVYMLLLVLAVPLLHAWERAGWSVLAGVVVLMAVIDVLVRVGHVVAAGWLSYLLAPGAGFLLGMAWRAGALARRAVPVTMLCGGVVILIGLVGFFGYPPWMVGIPGEPTSNTGPPNLALIAYATAQIGLVLLCEPPLRRWLERPRVWGVVARGNVVLMTLYLWHMVPVIILAPLLAVAGLLPGPPAGTLGWWGLRFLWVGALAVLFAGVIGMVGRFERPRPPRLRLAGWVASALLVVCAAATGYALSRLAVGGFAPAGELAAGPLVIYAAGMLALWLAGRSGTKAPA